MAILGMNTENFKESILRSLKEKSEKLRVLFDDNGWVNLQNNPEMISRMYEIWKSLTTKIPEEILRRSIFRNVLNTTKFL